MTSDALTNLADAALAIARQAQELREAYAREMGAANEENARLRADLEQAKHDQTAAVQAAVARIGRNPDTSRAMEEAFEAGRRAGLAEAAGMAETYAFFGRSGHIQLGTDRNMVPIVQIWLAEHIRARAEGQDEPERETYDPRMPPY